MPLVTEMKARIAGQDVRDRAALSWVYPDDGPAYPIGPIPHYRFEDVKVDFDLTEEIRAAVALAQSELGEREDDVIVSRAAEVAGCGSEQVALILAASTSRISAVYAAAWKRAMEQIRAALRAEMGECFAVDVPTLCRTEEYTLHYRGRCDEHWQVSGFRHVRVSGDSTWRFVR